MTKKLQKNIIYISSTKAHGKAVTFKGESWFHYLMDEKKN